MDPKPLLDLYARVRDRHALPKMDHDPVSLSTATERFASAREAQAALAAFQPTQGWVGFQSANRHFTDGAIPPMDDATGQLLAAEAVNAAGGSLHIRYDGTADWIVTRFTVSVGDDCLADRVEHIGYHKDLGTLRYRRIWRIDGGRGAEPCAACFIGFADA